MSSADDIARQLHALCVAKGWRAIELSVSGDGRVCFMALGLHGYSLGHVDADLLTGSALPTPGIALRRLGDLSESEQP